MKKLTTEEKARRYNEAIEVTKKLVNAGLIYEDVAIQIFSELKEGEDEKWIPKEITKYLKEKGDFRSCWLAWLEKQGEQKTTVDTKVIIPKFRVGDIVKSKSQPMLSPRKIISIGKDCYFCEDRGCIGFAWEDDYVIVEQKSALPKWKYKNDNTPLLRDSIILNKYGCVAQALSGALVRGVWVIDYDELVKLPKEEIEGQGEPKFKNGQWIVWQDKCYKVNYNGCGYELVDKNGLSTSLEYGTVDENARLWDITKDAKDGDVLVAFPIEGQEGKEQVFIFKGINNRDYVDDCIEYYCRIYDGKFYVNKIGYMGTTYSPLYLATKEQRDLLFAKMEEAGYEWNAEKKELKKIGQNFTDFETCLKHIMEEAIECGDTHNLKSDAEMLLKVAHKHAEWSEEDEEKFRDVIRLVEQGAPVQSMRDHYINWLNSVKERVQIQLMKGE